MRIVLILSSFPQLSESFIVNKFVELFRNGWDVHVVCSSSQPDQWRHFAGLTNDLNLKKRVHKNWPVRPHWLAGALWIPALLTCLVTNSSGTLQYLLRGWKRSRWNILKRFYLDARIIALKPDLIHFEFGATAIQRSDLNSLLECKEVVSFRGYDLNFSGLDQPGYYDEIWHNADVVHFLGNDLHQRALRRGCPKGKPYFLIPPAIDSQYFSPANRENPAVVGTKNRPLRILSVGRLEWKKGYEFGFQAVRLCLDQGIDCEYRIVGAGSYEPALGFARHQLGLDDVIYFLGGMPRDAVLEHLKWADVFLHPAVSEGFCNAVLEAQSMQVPVVCSDSDGLSENVANGITGFVVPRRNPQALADALIRLAQSADLRTRMGKAGRERVIAQFQLKDQIIRFEELYTRITAS